MPSFWKSRLEPLSSNLHFIVIGIVILSVGLLKSFFLLAFIIYFIYLFKRRDIPRAIKISLFIFAVIFIVAYYIPYPLKEINSCKGLVLEKKNNKIVVLVGFKKYLIYGKSLAIPGDYVSLELREKTLNLPDYSGDFNEVLYLKASGYSGTYRLNSLTIIKSYKTLGYLKYLSLEYYKKQMAPNIYLLFKALVFGDNTLDESVKNSLGRLNLAHILALSGMHIHLIYLASNKILFLVTKRKYLSEKISLAMLGLYTIFCGLQLSLLRALIFLLLNYYNKNSLRVFTRLDLFSITFLILLINPLRIYSLGFILSFLSAFTLIFMDDFIKAKNKLLKDFLIGLILLLVNFPFITNINNEMSIFSLVSFLLIDFYTYFFIPLSFLFLVVPSLSLFIEDIYLGFNSFISLISNSFCVSYPYMNSYFKLLYYLILIFILVGLDRKKIRKGLIFLFISILILFKLSYKIEANYLEFVSVGQGDTCYINSNRKSFLIDCYNVKDFLEKRDIRSLEAIFITHSDNDHMGDLALVLGSIRVKAVYINIYDNGIDEICRGNRVKLIKLKKGDFIRIGEASIRVLGPENDLEEKNSNSLVLDISMLNKSFLFMGDATIKTEEALIEAKALKRYDLLKVGHHGSNTSSSSRFLEIVRPKYAIISLGENNYGMPNQEVLLRLRKYAEIYITKASGNIKFSSLGLKPFRNICYN